jgi:hypothetical protein
MVYQILYEERPGASSIYLKVQKIPGDRTSTEVKQIKWAELNF